MTRRLAIAQALLGDPKVLILDEPTAGLDPLQRAVTREAIKKLKTGRIVVLSTHLLEDARAVADRLLVLVDGRLLFDGDVASLEALDSPSAPGESPLERALNALMLRRKGSPE
jgi:ABC-2 type transport system ATP-binding protein